MIGSYRQRCDVVYKKRPMVMDEKMRNLTDNLELTGRYLGLIKLRVSVGPRTPSHVIRAGEF